MSNNLRAGIVSVTFRQYAFRHFIEYIKPSGLSCIEWGGDIHAPYNDLQKAEAIAGEMQKNNLATASYGSYYRLGQTHEPEQFSMILETAKKLSAPMIRVWGGAKASRKLTKQERKEIIGDALVISEKARQENIKVSLEYHADTITDTIKSALDFIREVRKQGGGNIYLYWQPNQFMDYIDNKSDLMLLCPYLTNIHVFAWDKTERLPLTEHKDRWKSYIHVIKNHGGEHDFLLEFVKDDAVGQMLEDAKILIELLDI